MPFTKLPNYLRTYRKRSYLSQDEVAFLLGCRNGSKVSRYENFSRRPSPETIFAYEVLFNAPARKLFAGRYRSIEQRTIRRVRTLERRLSKSEASPLTERKLEILRAVVSAQKTEASKE